MKKTLIALTALAATTAAFAQTQVEVTGKVSLGYQDTNIAPSTTAAKNFAGFVMGGLAGGWGRQALNPGSGIEFSGLGVDTAELNLKAVEDLGAGMKVIAKMQFAQMDRGGNNTLPANNGILGGDTSLALLTPAGELSMASLQQADYLSGALGNVGAPGLDGMVFLQRGYADQIAFTTHVEKFVVSVTEAEGGGLPLAGTCTGNVLATGSFAAPVCPAGTTLQTSSGMPVPFGLGLGAGMAGQGAASTTGQQSLRSLALSLTYLGGPLVANVGYTSYLNMYNTAGTTSPSDTSYANTARASARYDAGSFKVGAAYLLLTMNSGMTVSEAFVSTATSFGLVDLAAGVGNFVINGSTVGGLCTLARGAGCADGTRSGYSASATYNLSKSTNVALQYWNWIPYAGASTQSTQTELALTKNF